MKTLTLLFLMAVGCGGAASSPPSAPAQGDTPDAPRNAANAAATTHQAMQGEWVSSSGEVRPGPNGSKLYLKRVFSNRPERARAQLVFFTDETFSTRSITLDLEGPYELGRASDVVPGAVEATFSFDRLVITPHNDAMVGFLSSAPPGTCGNEPWAKESAQDVSASGGCSVFGIELGKYKEYDLVKVDGDRLFYGARPADGGLPTEPSRRATTLQVALIRQR
jgi:hypothetical protein